jgi:Gp49-like protein DUF891
MKKFIIYEGEEFTLEWYFDSRGKSSAREYYEELSEDRKDKIFRLFETLGDVGKIFNKEKFRNEDDQIYAFKSKPDRFFCFFFEGSKVIVTNACEKKQDKLPHREKEKAMRMREDYKKRCKGGTYYA